MERNLLKKPALANLKDLTSARDELRIHSQRGEPFRPIDAEVRINWRCNAKCEMCGLESYMEKQSAFRRKEMSTSEATTTLAQLASLGCKRVTISGGEPSLHRGLEEIVRFAS